MGGVTPERLLRATCTSACGLFLPWTSPGCLTFSLLPRFPFPPATLLALPCFQVVKSLGVEIPEVELQEMIEEFSGGRDAIDEATFLRIMNAADDGL